MPAPILIIGGGLGGLCLAQGLKKNHIPFHVYEKDSSLQYRPQGYRIRISSDGANALKANLTPELWTLFEATCGITKFGMTQMNALDPADYQGQGGADPRRHLLRINRDAPQLGPYTVDRTTLRRLLCLGLEENISFGKEGTRFETTEAGVTAYFKDGTSAEGSLLIGAEGLRSPVRRQHIPDHPIVDCDARCIYGKTPLTAEIMERFPEHARQWITVISDPTPVSLFLEPVRFETDPAVTSEGRLSSVSNYIYWVLGSRSAQFGIPDDELLKMTGQQAADLSLKLTEKWDPKIRSLLELQAVDQTSALRFVSVLPNMPAWTPSARITFLGDAIHTMSPAGGSGANIALYDAQKLCSVIVNAGSESVSAEAIGKYEDEMRKYAGDALIKAAMGAKKIFEIPAFEDCKRLDL
jgi:2-polyprenyl-6-methoxyphenol hydroxylase-like FAD-dependent oxidoreductase